MKFDTDKVWFVMSEEQGTVCAGRLERCHVGRALDVKRVAVWRKTPGADVLNDGYHIDVANIFPTRKRAIQRALALVTKRVMKLDRERARLADRMDKLECMLEREGG